MVITSGSGQTERIEGANSKFGEKDYVKRRNLSEISKILLVKLNMIYI